MPITLTDKQNEYIRHAHRRWNFKVGATGSGKTYMDTAFTIPLRIRERAGKDGLTVIIGNTKGTLQRNIIEPLQEHYTEQLVSNIGADNTCTMFGEKVYCLGADKVNQVTKIQGATIKYCYGDEMTTWNEEVFQMLKSRLRTPYSIFDGTMNPASPKHFMKSFIDSDADIYCQHYTIDDNPTLPPDFVRELKKEYEGTVYYDWYILGRWSRPSGLAFPKFANNPDAFIIKADKVPKRFQWNDAGFDIGGNKSAYAMTFSGLGYDNAVYGLRATKKQAPDLPMELVENYAFDEIDTVENKYNLYVNNVNTDHVDVIINTCNEKRYIFGKTFKPPLEDRVFLLNRLMAQERLWLVEGQCDDLKDELQNAVLDDKAEKAVILDDGSMQIDTIDSFIYSLANNWHYLND